MSTFLISNKNLKDVTDIQQARHNIGLGTLSTQNADDVTISGGNITVDELSLKADGNREIRIGDIIRARDNAGNMEFQALALPGWAMSNQYEVDVGTFNNDIGYITIDAISQAGITGKVDDVIGLPQYLSELDVGDNLFLSKSENLSDIHDPVVARSNLGLGTLATQNLVNVEVENLTVRSQFRFIPAYDIGIEAGMFLTLDDDYQAMWSNLPIASENEYGVIQLDTREFSELGAEEPDYKAVTSKALIDSYHSLLDQITELNDTSSNLVISEINKYNLIRVDGGNFDAIENFADKIQEALGIETLGVQSKDNVNVGNLTVESTLRVDDEKREGLNPSLPIYLTTDSEGAVTWENIPFATNTSPGVVYVYDIPNAQEQEDFFLFDNDIANGNEGVTVPTVRMYESLGIYLDSRIQDGIDRIPRDINDLLVGAGAQFVELASDNFDNINAEEAIKNMGLHAVATSGKWSDLTDKPEKLSDFDTSGFCLISNNLNDVENTAEARKNLGLGTMSIQNNDNVNIVNGVANLTNLTVTNHFAYLRDAHFSDTNMQFLKCINQAGECVWSELPIATETTYGTVKFANSLSVGMEENTVVSAFCLATVTASLVSKTQALLDSFTGIMSAVNNSGETTNLQEQYRLVLESLSAKLGVL